MMFTGTSQQQDTRFSDKEKKLLKEMKFGDCLNKRVDMTKVKLEVLRPWISKRITELLNIEDDVVTEFVYNQLEGNKFPCPKKMQINMTGFLNGPNAREFMGELWSLLLAAQASKNGIPPEFLEQKKDEILKREEPPKIPKDYRPNAISGTNRERTDRRSITDNSSGASVSGGGEVDNGNMLSNVLQSKDVDNYNILIKKERDNRHESPNAIKSRPDLESIKSSTRDDEPKDITEKITDLNSDTDKKYIKTTSKFSKTQKSRSSHSRKLSSGQHESLKSPKSSLRYSRGRSTERKIERQRNSPSSSSYSRHHQSQHQHASRHKENYRRSRSRSRRTNVRDRRRSSRSRDAHKYSRRRSPSSSRKRRYSHSRQKRRDSRSESRRKYHTRSPRRSSSVHNAIKYKQNGSDDRYKSHKSSNQRDLDMRRNVTKSSSNRKHSASVSPPPQRNSHKQSADWHNEGSGSYRRHSPEHSYSRFEHNIKKERKRSLPPSHANSISLSPEPVRNNNMDYKSYPEGRNQRRQSPQYHQPSQHHNYHYQQQQSRYGRSGRASSMSSNEYGPAGNNDNRMSYYEHERFGRDERFHKGTWDNNQNNKDQRNIRSRSHSDIDHRNISRRSSPHQSAMTDYDNARNYPSGYQYQQQQQYQGDRSFNSNNYDNKQYDEHYNGNRRSDQYSAAYRRSRERNISPSANYNSKGRISPLRQRPSSLCREQKKYSRERQVVSPRNNNRHPPSPPRKQRGTKEQKINSAIDSNTINLHEDSVNQKKTDKLERKEQIPTSSANSQKSKTNDKHKSDFDHEGKRIEDRRHTVSDASECSDISDIARNHYRDKLRKLDQTSAANRKNKEGKRAMKLPKTTNEGPFIVREENAKDESVDQKEKAETVPDILTTASATTTRALNNVEGNNVRKDRENIAISKLPLSEATAATEAASASLAATLALAGSLTKPTQQPVASVRKPIKSRSLKSKIILPVQPAPPYQFNRETTSLSRTPSPFMKPNNKLISLEKSLLRTIMVNQERRKNTNQRCDEKPSDKSASESSSDDDDENSEDTDETDDNNSGQRTYKRKSGDEKCSKSNGEANKADKNYRSVQKGKKKIKNDTSDESDAKQTSSTTNPRKTSATDLAHKPSDTDVRKSKSDCNFGVMTDNQRYAIAAIMTLRKAEKRKQGTKDTNIDLHSLLNSDDGNMQNSRQKKRRLSDSDCSQGDDRYERAVREKVSLSVQKYGARCRDASRDHAKRRKHSSVERERSISSILSSPTDHKLLSPIKKHKSLFEKLSTQNVDVREKMPNEYEDADGMSKRKSRKKHKKHSSKKSRKHKKHKKKEKHASTVASSSDDNNQDDDVVDIDDNSSLSTIDMNTERNRDTSRYDRTSIGSNAIINLGANSINEDLERQLRERALKSMKKAN